ncbi:LysM peptidoglycan-binding domain-containing protein, partial [Camelimonas abortus]
AGVGQAADAGTAEPGAAGKAGEARAGNVIPAFDVVRVEPDGAAVIAGRAAPGAAVELLSRNPDGALAPLRRETADGSGLFAFTVDPLPRGRHELGLRATGQTGAPVQSRQTVMVDVDPPRPPLVALVEPDRPTRVLSRPEAPPAAPEAAEPAGGPGAPAGQAKAGETRAARETARETATEGAKQPDAHADAGVRVLQVEADDDGRLYVVGRAKPGATLRLYLNDALAASAVANQRGEAEFSLRWSMPGGDCRVRLDEVDPATGRVLSRAEAPWEPGRHDAAAQAAAQDSGAQGAAGDSGAAGAGQGRRPSQEAAKTAPARTHVVRKGESLWSISRRTYRLGSRYTTIYEANQDQIADRDLIYPGQVFVLPMPGHDPARGGVQRGRHGDVSEK